MTDKQNADLLPCPFCGGEAEMKQTGKNQITIRCMRCSAKRTQKVLRHSLEWLEKTMIDRWNTRNTAFGGMGDASYMHEAVKEQLEDEKSGYWYSCSGCYEGGEYGALEAAYPYSDIFKCRPGSGCHECGGIGVRWDGTDYSEYLEPAPKTETSPAPEYVQVPLYIGKDVAYEVSYHKPHGGGFNKAIEDFMGDAAIGNDAVRPEEREREKTQSGCPSTSPASTDKHPASLSIQEAQIASMNKHAAPTADAPGGDGSTDEMREAFYRDYAEYERSWSDTEMPITAAEGHAYKAGYFDAYNIIPSTVMDDLLAAREVLERAVSALDSLMGDSDLVDDNSPEFKACQDGHKLLQRLEKYEINNNSTKGERQ